MKKQLKKKQLDEDTVRVIKIGKEALFEFIYEEFVEKQGIFLDVDELSVADAFDIDFERGEFIFCAYKSENAKGDFLTLPKEMDLRQIMRNIPDTTDSMFKENRYKEYSKRELMELSEKP